MKDNVRESSGSGLLKYATFFSIVLLLTLFGTCAILQWKEIIKLNERVTKLELDRLVQVHTRSEIFSEQNTDARENFKDVYEQLLEEISKKQVELLKKYCANSSKVCIPGPPGPKGEKGDRGPAGPQGPKGEPGLPGNNSWFGTRVSRGFQDDLNDDPNSCCYSLAKPILLGPTTVAFTVNKGNDIILPCKPTGLPPAEVRWSPAVDPQQLGRYIQTVDGMLIKTADYTDTSTFTCHASNVFGSVDKTINLIVTDPIQVSVNPPSSQLNANQSIDLTCSYSGVPPPVVKWIHVKPTQQTEEITSGMTTSNQQSVLHLVNVDALSGGQYLCQAFNNYDNQSSTASLAVISKPYIVHGPRSQLVNAGTTVTLKCDVVADPPANIAWTFPKTGSIPPKTASINPDGSVTLFHVDSFSEGQYTCTATNTIGSSMKTGNLNINVPLSVTTDEHVKALSPGETFVQLTCHVSGGSQTSLTWSKSSGPPISANGKYLLVGEGLIITSVDQTGDSGVYVCNGTDGHQQASDKVILYKDLGQLTCSSNFSDCGVGVGGACGGTCPNSCTEGIIYGYQRYTLMSSICLAAEHTGGMANNKAIWTVEHSINTFEPQLSNGIQSQYSGPAAQEAVFFMTTQPTGQTP